MSSSTLSFLQRLVAFSELLRKEQFGVTPAETLDAAQAAMVIDTSNLEDFRAALKSALVKRSDDYVRFDQLFKRFWFSKSFGVKENPLGRISIPREQKIERTLRIPESPSNMTGRGRITAGSMFTSLAPVSPEGADKTLGIYSPLETTSRKSFEDLNLAQDRALLKRGLRSFARATATRPGRRFEQSQNGELDFRGMLRKNLRTGGHAIEIELRKRKLSKSRLVVLCDISGSMDSYSGRILKLIYHLNNTIGGSQVFGFSTRVMSLNRYLQGKSLSEAMRMISEHVDIWSSGTRIGSALSDLLANHSGILRSSTVFIVISDGWELGDIEVLRLKLSEIRRRVNRIVWLNPQADSADYMPLAEGMKSSLPYIDLFAGLDVFSNRAKFIRAFHPGASKPATFPVSMNEAKIPLLGPRPATDL